MKKINDELFYGDLAKYYDLILKFKDTNKECSFLKKVMDDFKVKSIIDTCCGAGRISCPLSEMGYNVLGFDINEDMIAVARKKGYDIGFFSGDMRNFNFGSEFDCAINMRTAMAYLYSPMELLDYFSCVYHSLNDDGIFIIEGCNPYLEKDEDYTRVSEDENIKIITDRTKKIINGNRYNKFEYTIIDKNTGDINFFEEEDVERLRNVDDIKYLLQKSGFNIIDMYGDFDHSKFNKDASDRLIILAKKETQFVGVGAVLFNEKGKLLIYERTDKSKIHPNTRSIPCGTVEKGETPEQCIKREMDEELGIEVEVNQLVSRKEFTYNNSNEKLTTYGFICKILQGLPKIMEPDKMKNLKYINIKNIPENFFPELQHVIKRLTKIS